MMRVTPGPSSSSTKNGPQAGKEGAPVDTSWMSGIPDSVPNTEKQQTPGTGGIIANAGAGTSDTTAALLGAPVDLATGALNLGARGVNALAGTQIPPIEKPVGGSDFFRSAFGYMGADPRTVVAGTPTEEAARAAGAGAASMLLPWAGARALPALAGVPGAVQQALGSGSASQMARMGAEAGAGGQLASDAVPDPWKPVANVAGNLVGAAIEPLTGLTASTVGRGLASVPPISTMKPIVSSAAQEASVGRTLQKFAGNLPVEESKVGPLSLAQATNDPEIAARADLAPSYNASANAALMKAQQEAVQKQIGQVGASSTSPDASAAFTGALRKGREVAGSEENRLWNVPELAQMKVTPDPIKAEVGSAIATIDPVLRSSMSPELTSLVNRLMEARPTTVQDLNGIRSNLERIARNPNTDGGQKSMARTISGAFLNGMDKVPEIAGAPALEAASADTVPAAVPNAVIHSIPSFAGSDRAPESIVDFLIAKGGVQNQGGDLSSIGADAIHHRGGGRLVNAKGFSPDYAREAAEEAGFLPPHSTINDLYDKIGEHISGRPQYRISDQAEGNLRQQAETDAQRQSHAMFMASGDVQAQAEGMGARLSPAEAQRASELVSVGVHPEEAIRQAVWPTQEAALNHNAQASSFTSPGMPHATQMPLPTGPGPQVAIPANPAIAQAYQTARNYTRQMRTMFGTPDAAALLNKNAAGVFTKDASEGARQFFNFSNGSPEGPQSIAQLSDFVGQLKVQPMAAQISGQMKDAARSYVAAALTKAARAEEGQNFNPKTMQDFLRTNGPWIKNSGLFESPQIDAADHLLEYSGMLRRPEQLLRQVNSATQARLARKDTFVDQIMNPVMRRIIEIGGALGGAHQGGIIGGIIGTVLGGGFDKMVTGAEASMRGLMAEALLDPAVAKGLMMKSSAGNRVLMAPTARQAIDTARAAVAASVATEARLPQLSGQQPTSESAVH